MVREIDKCKDRHLCIVYNYSPPPTALALSGGIPGLRSHSCAYCCHLGLPESRIQPVADTQVAAGSHWSSLWTAVSVMVGGELREAIAFSPSGTAAPWSSWQSFSALPARTSAWCATACFPALDADTPQELLTELWGWTLGHHCSWNTQVLSATVMLLAALSASPGDPLFRKPELLTSAAIWKIRPVVLSRKSRTVN